jgi:hypothetical protein
MALELMERVAEILKHAAGFRGGGYGGGNGPQERVAEL